MSKFNIKSGDTVLVLAGKDNGKTGTIKSISSKTSKVVVEGINIQTKTKKAKKADQKSEIVKVEGAIDASNVMIVCPTCGKATRVARTNDGKSVRICKKCGATLDVEKKVKKAAKTKAVKAEKVEEVAETKATKTTKKAPVRTTKAVNTKVPKATAAKTTVRRVVKTQGDK